MAERKTDTTWDEMMALSAASRGAAAPAVVRGPADAGKRRLLSAVVARIAAGPEGNDPVVENAAPAEWVFDSAKAA